MARLGRYFLPQQPLHVIHRGNNRQPIFLTGADAKVFAAYLQEAAVAERLVIHAYVFMTNHIHLLASPATEQSLPRAMQTLGQRYVRYFNRTHGRTGTLWEGRYRATVVCADAYFFACSRYVELNPVRAALTSEPGTHRWSSYGANALGKSDPLVTPHDLYDALGPDARTRTMNYRALFAAPLSLADLTTIRESTHYGWALGPPDFQERAAAAGRRGVRLPTGRPARMRSGSE